MNKNRKKDINFIMGILLKRNLLQPRNLQRKALRAPKQAPKIVQNKVQRSAHQQKIKMTVRLKSKCSRRSMVRNDLIINEQLLNHIPKYSNIQVLSLQFQYHKLALWIANSVFLVNIQMNWSLLFRSLFDELGKFVFLCQ